jgi:acetyl-CoA carboxylase biotin carboxylase subunit
LGCKNFFSEQKNGNREGITVLKKIQKVLIANRGEIALRIIRACHELGIQTVAIYTVADKYSLHVKYSDDQICIGDGPAQSSYLNIPLILAAAEATAADAIHPGYGFLSENTQFVEACEACKLTFIGPHSMAIHKLGDKIAARALAQQYGVPILPGCEVLGDDLDALKSKAKEIGYPIMAKASDGGGGRGNHLINSEEDLIKFFNNWVPPNEKACMKTNFYIERFLNRARHIEFQILADQYGNIICLGDRDCTIQRRYQKILEESPAPGLTSVLRESGMAWAINLAKAVDYHTVGTFEFLMDESDHLYFMETNTRIQVEHPVTEMVTGLDLVKLQILMAAGHNNPFDHNLRPRGHSIECRINAEDPKNNFLPTNGKIKHFYAPGGPGIRVDTVIYSGYQIPVFYDNLLVKILSHDRNRQEAIIRLRYALDQLVIEGVITNIDLHKKLLESDQFIHGKGYWLDFIEHLNKE